MRETVLTWTWVRRPLRERRSSQRRRWKTAGGTRPSRTSWEIRQSDHRRAYHLRLDHLFDTVCSLPGPDLRGVGPKADRWVDQTLSRTVTTRVCYRTAVKVCLGSSSGSPSAQKMSYWVSNNEFNPFSNPTPRKNHGNRPSLGCAWP